MTSCGHSFCLECIKPFGQFEKWNCAICRTPQTDSPKETSRNYALEQVLQSSSVKPEQEKIDRAKHKLNSLVETMITKITDQQLKINELIEKEPDQFKEDILRRDFFFQLTLRKFSQQCSANMHAVFDNEIHYL